MGKKNKGSSDREDRVLMEGLVLDALPAGMFRVNVAGNDVVANLSGRLRQNKIKIIPGDTVEVEFSPYDLTRGRISRRK